MFGFVENNKTFIKVILGGVALTFVGFGVAGYSSDGDDGHIAEVGKHRLYRYDLERALQGKTPDEASKKEALDGLIQQELLLNAAELHHDQVSPAEVRRAILGITDLQKDGKFDAEAYKQYLTARQMSASDFENQIKRDIQLRNQLNPYLDSHFMPSSVTTKMVELLTQSRQIASWAVAPDFYYANIAQDDATLKKFYDAHKSEFKQAERVKLDYVLLSPAEFAKTITVSDAEAQAYFKEHSAEMQLDQRRVAHILLTTDASMSAEDKAKVKARAEELAKQVQAKPESFADVAKKESQDPGSKDQGGDLGFLTKGSMVKPFEDAAYAMKTQNEISPVVESEFGFHILKLEEVKIGSFDDVKEQIVAQLQKTKSAQAYRDAADKLADISYQQPTSLQATASALNLTIASTDWVTKKGSLVGDLASPKVLEAAFSADVLKKKNNSEPIDLGGNKLAVVRINTHEPEVQLSFEQVKDQVKTMWLAQESSKLAASEGAKNLKALQAGQTVAGVSFGATFKANRKDTPNLDPESARVIFSASTAKFPSYAGALNPKGEYVIYRVDAVEAGPALDPVGLKALSAQLAQLEGSAMVGAYLGKLRAMFPVVIKTTAVAQ